MRDRLIAEAARRELARRQFESYVEYVHGGLYQHARHTRYICQKLDELEQGKINRMMIFMPPRHSKSMTITETFPSYFIGKSPHRRVIEVSYSDDFAQKFGRANRNKIAKYGQELFGINIARDNNTKTNWGIAGHRGGMISAGLGGTITGEGADLLIIDDPIKNRQEADSVTYRNRLWDEWESTILTRLQPGAAVIIILTRWHEDDLAGRLLKQDPGKWVTICLPCEAKENDILGRKPGAPLWPEIGFDEEWMKAKKQEVGSRTWNALYQQQPTPEGGGMVKRSWLKYYTAPPSGLDFLVLSADCTFKEHGSSYVVLQVWGRDGANKYLIDQVRARMDIVETIRRIKMLVQKYPTISAKLIEDKANGPAIVSMLKNSIPGVIAVNPAGGKVARLQAVLPEFEAGNIFLPEKAPWIGDYVEELVAFPSAEHDDQVDATSQALIYYQKNQIIRPGIRL